MGIVGIAACLALLNATGNLTDTQGAEADDAGQTDQDQASSSGSLQTGVSGLNPIGSSSSNACTLQCERRCSYPGHCRRYRDTNQNNRCDYGECLAAA